MICLFLTTIVYTIGGFQIRSGKLKVRKMINENPGIRPLLIPTVYSIGVGGGEWGVGSGERRVGGWGWQKDKEERQVCQIIYTAPKWDQLGEFGQRQSRQDETYPLNVSRRFFAECHPSSIEHVDDPHELLPFALNWPESPLLSRAPAFNINVRVWRKYGK